MGLRLPENALDPGDAGSTLLEVRPLDIGIIGGTGFYQLTGTAPRRIETEYGSATVYEGGWSGQRVVFLPRHGAGHTSLPHQVNYRANIAALSQLGIRRILAASAVGSLHSDWHVGDLALCDQIIDMTRGREHSFGKFHVDFTEPYCPDLRATLLAVAREQGAHLHERATYVCTEGPRYESAAEVRLFASWGGDLVGMTNMPEAALAREAGICYSTLAVVTNVGAGLLPELQDLESHRAVMRASIDRVLRLFQAALPRIAAEPTCPCHRLPPHSIFTVREE